MKFIAGILVLVLGAVVCFGAEPEFSGVLDSTVNYTVLTDSPYHSFGFEEYANLRLRVRASDNILFYSAFNVVAVGGNYLLNPVRADMIARTMGSRPDYHNLGYLPFIAGANYAAALELERLYFRINGEFIDTEAGLLRLNFGYGQVWGSSDFLNPRNPMSQNARPRGILGMDFSFYPTDTMKLLFFAATPGNPLESGGGGFMPGLTLDKHWDFASVQALYSYETPLANSDYGTHRFGLSLKVDLELGIVADGLYILNAANPDNAEGLSVGAGFDYSFLDGDIYTLWEYLYNGSASSTSAARGGYLTNHHYLYAGIMNSINDYAKVGYSAIYCFDDPSFSHSIVLEYEVFQGFSLSLNARLPMDMRTPDGTNEGELGPAKSGSRFSVDIGASLRF